ncbi:MAG: hypothetical protein ACLPV4_20305 [Solirubrobacteraceae bacterium]
MGEIRLGPLSLALLAGLSCAATVLIISGGSGRSAAQLAALAALRQRPVVIAAHGSAAGSASRSAPARAAGPVTESSSAPAASRPATASPSAATTAQNTATTSAPSTATSATDSLPKVGHVFEIALSTDSYRDAFGKPSAAPYLRSLERKGVLLNAFQSLGSSELADYLAMVSGQGPNADTSGGCTTYSEFPQGVAAQPDGLVRGNGCVYPETALTIGDQVTASGHMWKAYIADMGAQTCAHPNSNAVVDSALPGTQLGYDTGHNPFIYFHSLVDLGDCANDDQDLSRLGPALAKRSRTATFSFIAPGVCDDPASDGAAGPAATTPTSTTSTTTSSATTASTTASSTTTAPATASSTTSSSTTSSGSAAPAACPAGQPAGIVAENAFLRLWVPRILASPAYRHDGVLIIAFAAAGHRDSARPVRTGALLLSRYARPGKQLRRAFGPYSLLRSIETMLGYKPLAHARTAPSFAAAALTHTK